MLSVSHREYGKKLGVPCVKCPLLCKTFDDPIARRAGQTLTLQAVFRSGMRNAEQILRNPEVYDHFIARVTLSVFKSYNVST